MKRERILLLVGILVLLSLTLTSAKLGYNTQDTGVKNINQNVTTNQNYYNVTGSNINASSIDCGSDFLQTYDNFTGLFTCQSVSLGSETDPYWSDNFTKYNSSWSSTYNATYNTWAYNQTTAAVNQILVWSYYNNSFFPYTHLSNFTNDLSFYIDNSHNYYNSTTWNNPYTYWNSTFATFNKTYADTLYYPYTSNPFGYLNTSADSFAGNYTNFSNVYAYTVNGTFYLATNPNSYITLNQYFSNATSEFYPLNSNPYSYLNTSTETNWNANYSQVLNLLNNGYSYYNSSDFDINDYYLNTNPFSFYNSTDFDIADYYLLDNPFGYYNSTTLPTGISWSEVTNGTVYLSNNTYGFYNSTSLTTNSQLLNGFGFYNSTNWDNPYNYTNFTVLSDYVNDLSFYIDNTHNYTNFTKLSDYQNDLSFYLDNSHSYYNSTNWNNPFNYTNFTVLSDFVNDLTFYVDNTHNYTNFTTISQLQNDANYITIDNYFDNATVEFYPYTSNPYSYLNTSSESDPYWSDNFTLYNSTWTSTYNATYDSWAYNQTEVAIDVILTWAYYNSSDFDIADYSTTTQMNTAIENANTTLYNWVVAQGYTAGAISWSEATNGTLYLSSNPYSFYNSTSWTNPYSYFNLTNYPNYANVYLNTTNQFNYTNFTKLSDYVNDLTFYVDNTHSYYNSTTWNNPYTYWNSTFATFNKTYADTLYYGINNAFGYYNSTTLASAETDPKWTGNYTLVPFLASANTFTENQTVEGVILEKDTTNHRIYDNSSCIIIKAGGTELRLCE